jgi:hypothetical protein
MATDLTPADDSHDTRASRWCKQLILPFDVTVLLVMAVVMVAITAWMLG